MLSESFDILTPLVKVHRISRPIYDMETFTVIPGQWIGLVPASTIEGAVDSLSTLTDPKIAELCISHAVKPGAPASAYEGNDTKVGRISTISEPGVRAVFGVDLLHEQATTDYSIGGDVYAGTDGLLVSSANAGAGDIKVGYAESVSAGAHIVIKTTEQSVHA